MNRTETTSLLTERSITEPSTRGPVHKVHVGEDNSHRSPAKVLVAR
jgi:hypothetical protein